MTEAIELLAGYLPAPLRARVAPEPPTGYLLLDVFTAVPFAGNPLAVVPDGRGLDGEQMQRAARELNLAETVFVLPSEGDGEARIRIFTPAVELPFAGHPVLGAAVVVAGALRRERVRLETGQGLVAVTLEQRAEDATFGRMQQPIPEIGAFARAAELFEALGVSGSELPVEQYVNGPRHVLVALPSEDVLAALRVDSGALAELGEICVSCFAGRDGRWKTRMFAPALGVPEDPATGSAAGPLAVHLARHGRIAFGAEIEIRQGEEIGRPSLLYARVEGSGERIERVEVAGSAVFVGRGELLLA